jgi:oxygen-independent coproporphyrinogen III oxidase
MFNRLYIHIPWCLRKCPYCAFSSATPTGDSLDETPGLLIREMELAASSFIAPRLSSVYIGGGTPSLLAPDQIGRLVTASKEIWGHTADCEITLECNPGTVSADALVEYQQAGIDRLSIGVQSLSDRYLTILGRIHTAKQARDTFTNARKAGFKSISIDLISALPHQTMLEWEQELEEILRLSPDHLSIYSLTLEPGTLFSDKYEQDRCFLPDDDTTAAMMDLTQDLLEGAGYERYEISSYARPGHRSRHNSGYWHRDGYLGVGPGAHSFIKNGPWGTRFSNPPEFDQWKTEIVSGRVAHKEFQQLTAQESLEEFFFLGLRTSDGIELPMLDRLFGPETITRYSRLLKELETVGLMQRQGDHVRLTRQGMMLSNQVFIRFLQ